MRYAKNVLLAGVLALSACLPVLQSRYVAEADIQRLPSSYEDGSTQRQGRACASWEGHLPDTLHVEHTPMRYIRVNVHWMHAADSLMPFSEDFARRYAKNLLYAGNYDLNKNRQMFLPHGNATPVHPIRMQYVLTPRTDDPDDDGIYFHYDEASCYYVHRGRNMNIFRRDMFDKYGVQLDTVLNIFILPHHPDSLASPTYSNYSVGAALRNAIKIAGVYNNHQRYEDYWDFRGILNHELGHILGLGHAWVNDGCDDTPVHKQECFSRGQPPPCDTLTSNNVMDYAAESNAWTPCQLGKVHQRLSDERSIPRKFLLPNWCERKDSMSITIRDAIAWRGAKDLEGDLIIERGGQLSIGCRVSMPPGGRILIAPGGTLVLEEGARLHQACGEQWDGILIQKKAGESGRLVLVGAPKLEDMQNELPPLP